MDLSGGVTLSSFVLGMAWMKTRILAWTLKTSFAHHQEQQHNRILRLKSPAQRARRKFLICRSTDLTIRDAPPRYGDERQSGIVEVPVRLSRTRPFTVRVLFVPSLFRILLWIPTVRGNLSRQTYHRSVHCKDLFRMVPCNTDLVYKCSSVVSSAGLLSTQPAHHALKKPLLRIFVLHHHPRKFVTFLHSIEHQDAK